MTDDEDCSKPICKDSPFANLRKMLGAKVEEECPLDRRELGRYSWALMHTFAAYYPQKPTNSDKQSMKGFLQGFKNLYPCTHCRGHFQKDYNRDPPNLDDHKQLNIWVCRQHNYVNKILGKSEEDCSYEKLMARWKTGCDSEQL